MTRKLKALGLALVAALSLSAFFISRASTALGFTSNPKDEEHPNEGARVTTDRNTMNRVSACRQALKTQEHALHMTALLEIEITVTGQLTQRQTNPKTATAQLQAAGTNRGDRNQFEIGREAGNQVQTNESTYEPNQVKARLA